MFSFTFEVKVAKIILGLWWTQLLKTQIKAVSRLIALQFKEVKVYATNISHSKEKKTEALSEVFLKLL